MHISKFTQFVIHILLQSYIITNIGCYTYSAGTLSHIEPLPGTERVMNYKADVSLVSNPSPSNPKAIFKVMQTPRIEYTEVEKYKEIKEVSELGTSLVFGPLVIGGLLLINKNLVLGGLLGLTGGVAIWAAGSDRGKKIETGVYVDGSKRLNYTKGESSSAPKVKVGININSIVRTYQTDQSGFLEVNIAEDFNLNSLKYLYPDQTFKLKCSTVEDGGELDLSITVKDFAVPFINITNDNVDVVTEEQGNLKMLGKAFRNEEYKILFEKDDLIKIQYKDKEGYIPANSGTKFWAVPDYLEKYH